MSEVQEKKMGVGARIGYFFLALLPAVLCIVMQVAALMIIVLPMYVVSLVNGTIDTSSQEAILEGYQQLALSLSPTGVFLYHVLGIIVFGLWYRFSFKKPRPTIKSSFQKTTAKAALIALICGIAFVFFNNATVIVESYLIPDVVENYIKMAETAGFGNDTLVIFATIILAPIGEEFLCRGVTLKLAKKSFGKFWIANILQAFLFGCIHANWVQGIYAFFIGLVLGWIVERYQTIVPAILMHFVINFSASTWSDSVLEMLFGVEFPSIIVGVIMLILSGAVILAMMYWECQRKEALTNEQDEIPSEAVVPAENVSEE